MTTLQAERLLMLLERIAVALERTAALDPMAALADALQQQPEPATDAAEAEAWRFR
jgi:hypothetical protein